MNWEAIYQRFVIACLFVLGDGSARTWDIRTGHVTNVIPAFSGEVLSCDWTKYDSVRSFNSIYSK